MAREETSAQHSATKRQASGAAKASPITAINRALARMDMVAATLVLTGFAIILAITLHTVIELIFNGYVYPSVLISATVVTILVAAPITYYSQYLIRRLARSRREQRALTEKLALALDQAQAADETRLRYFADANHELRTPLNAILGFSEMLTAQALGPIAEGRYVDYANDIHRSAEHLLAIVNDLLDLARTEVNGREVANDGECDVRQVIEDTLHMVWPAAEREGVRLDSRIAPAIYGLHANERMLKQILLNLLSNAIKFSPGGAVMLHAQLTEGGDLAIIAADNGIGMSAGDITVALTPFGQVKNGLTSKHAGTGLGLPLAKAMMEMHGGSLRINSEPRHGTTVTLRFPANRVLPAPTTSDAVAAPALEA